ncbi:NAD(P)/FAD-dependent oxidoreductase [Paludibacterium paludis]|uniref:NAD/FAD-dependent oxidoreductase n=1 Tax=Paludibacterium paludis TaxID=1225769 RepID=A0A918P6C3_9NEIS|nr:FAD-dependent oxidoreductase [Paludibacterium paludis]GGY25303.1 NAD/FAD-dependent oxidoreductase [Paludibacterium paludis]
MKDIAIVGAGMAGASCAAQLASAGLDIAVYDAAPEVGGRMTSRFLDGHQFDHGTQYFTARHPAFAACVDDWVAQGHAALWQGRFASWNGQGFCPHQGTSRIIGQPDMGAPCRALLRGVPTHTGHRLTGLAWQDRAWQLIFDNGEAALARYVVLAMPACRAAELIPPNHPLHRLAAASSMTPCFMLMMETDREIALPFDGIFVSEGPLSWAARESSKPGRPPGNGWVIQATAAWSALHIDDRVELIAATLQKSFFQWLHEDVSARGATLHRWLHGRATTVLGQVAVSAGHMGLAGDWLDNGRVEGAWLSGRRLADQILSDLTVTN